MSRRHIAEVVRLAGRYPFRPACSCGWSAAWGYVADHAALAVAEAHAGGVRS